MSVEVKVPTVGESITEVTIGQWLKADGEMIEMDEPICELESDKATFELNAEASGILKHKADEGDTLEIGQIICLIDPDGQKKSPSEKAPDNNETNIESSPEKKDIGPQTDSNKSSKSSPVKTGKTVEMHIPEVGESITEVTISNWTKKEGDFVELDEAIAEIESDKATFELTAEAQGILHLKVKEGQTLNIGELICTIEETSGSAPAKQAEPSEKNSVPTPEDKGTNYAQGHPSPAAAKLMAEKGLKPEAVKGTGVDGRITLEDAQKAQKPAEPKRQNEAEKTLENGQSISSPVKGERPEKREKMTTLRKTISRRLVAAKNETAMLTTFNEVNMKPIMEIRKKYKDIFKEKYEVNLGFMSFFTKACCLALNEWPAVNAMIDGEELVYHNYCDISIAVSTPRGLVVPVIRNAEKLSFDQIEKEIVKLATKARDGKLSIEEMQGGTFTITNGGIFGSMMSTPIINAPQSAILGMHNIVERPMAENGEIVIQPMMYVALSYDHRVIDGRESVSFLVRVKQLLEDPSRLLLGV